MASTLVSSNTIFNLSHSSVVPAEVTGEGKDRELTNMDLALKLHYIKSIYFFNKEAVSDYTIDDFKVPMFQLLNRYNAASGRIRRSEMTGRPFIKCNDSGVRILEGFCDKTIEEWLGIDKDHELKHMSLGDNFGEGLVYDEVLGPDLGFSPLVYVQFTRFKCGGMAVGLNWAHVLGDPISASIFINTWAQIFQGHVPKSLHGSSPLISKHTPSKRKPLLLKRVDPVGDHWVATGNCKLKTHSFNIYPNQLNGMLSKTTFGPTQKPNISYFQILSAIIWKSLSKIREDLGPKTVTICTTKCQNVEYEIPCNKMVFSVVQADFPVAKGDVYELAELIAEKQEEENDLIEEMLDDEKCTLDYMVYGTNLTFVNLEGVDIYGLELRGHKPIFANCNISGIGDEGAILVLPGPDKAGGGKTLTVTLPEDQLVKLKNELKRDWGLA